MATHSSQDPAKKKTAETGKTDAAAEGGQADQHIEDQRRQKAMEDLVQYVWHNRPAYFPVYGQTNLTGRLARLAEKTTEALIVLGALSGLVVGGLRLKDEIASRRTAHKLANEVPFK